MLCTTEEKIEEKNIHRCSTVIFIFSYEFHRESLVPPRRSRAGASDSGGGAGGGVFACATPADGLSNGGETAKEAKHQ